MNNSVIAATGTNIGVEISQNPASQTPQAKLGFQRSELAIVPTNKTDSNGTGANVHGDVLMEIRYGGIFDTGSRHLFPNLVAPGIRSRRDFISDRRQRKYRDRARTDSGSVRISSNLVNWSRFLFDSRGFGYFYSLSWLFAR